MTETEADGSGSHHTGAGRTAGLPVDPPGKKRAGAESHPFLVEPPTPLATVPLGAVFLHLVKPE